MEYKAAQQLTGLSLTAIAHAPHLEELRIFDRLALTSKYSAWTYINSQLLLHWAEHLPRLHTLVLKVWVEEEAAEAMAFALKPDIRHALPLLLRLRSLTLEGYNLRDQLEDDEQPPVVECLLTQAPRLQYLQIDGTPFMACFRSYPMLRVPSLASEVRRLPPDALAGKTVVIRTHRRGKFF